MLFGCNVSPCRVWQRSDLRYFEELYFGGRRLALEDRLGSSKDVRLLPYGEEISPTLNDRVKFATYFRDEDGIDYADQRYYSAGSGRFLTADISTKNENLADPTTWNAYSYSGGDPINTNDPTGEYGIDLYVNGWPAIYRQGLTTPFFKFGVWYLPAPLFFRSFRAPMHPRLLVWHTR